MDFMKNSSFNIYKTFQVIVGIVRLRYWILSALCVIIYYLPCLLILPEMCLSIMITICLVSNDEINMFNQYVNL